MNARGVIANRPVGTLKDGDRVEVERRVSAGDMPRFIALAADVSDHGVDRTLASDPNFRAVLAQGGLALTLLLTLIATRLPGPGTGFIDMSLDFEDVLKEGDLADAEVTVASLDEVSCKAQLDCRCRHREGRVVLSGRIDVIVPTTAVSRPFGHPVALEPGQPPDRFEHIEDLARQSGPIRMAVVNPVDGPSNEGAISSARAGLAETARRRCRWTPR